MGGRMSMIAATEHPDKVGAAASFHGGKIAVADDPESPHLGASRIRAKVYVAGAEKDDSYTPEQARLLETALSEAGVDHRLEIYPALHGFAVPDNPTHDPAAAARHWEALAELYGSALPR
jgi:carboxymethylenebutenolidase